MVAGDVNGDGADLVVGESGVTVSNHPGAGVVDLLLGGPNGLAEDATAWHQDVPEVWARPRRTTGSALR